MSTRTSVYLQLRRHKIKRISDKTGISEESLEEFDALYRKWCLKHYHERKYEYSEVEVRSFKGEISSPEVCQNFDAIMSSYFSIKKTKKHLDIVNVYCHRHRSEQEFAAAGSICDDIITSNRRTRGGNILRDVLPSHFKREDTDGSGDEDENEVEYLFEEFVGVISFIPGILYSTERDVFYDTIEEIHELFVLKSIFYDIHDVFLEPCIETRLDDKVLESLVSQMKRETSLKDQVKFQQPKSLYVLPSLLPKLRPKEIILEFGFPNATVSQLSETLKSAVDNIRIVVDLQMRLSECTQLPGQEEEEEVLPPLDMLRLTIHDDGYKDVESLRRPFSLATPPKELLRLRYVMSEASRGERFIANVINRTFPTTREEGGGGRGSTDLDMVLNEGPAPDIKLLLQSLTVPSPPLRKIWIILPFDTPNDDDYDVEELKRLCKNKEVKRLMVSNGPHDVMVNADSEEEEEEQQQQRVEERKREEGDKEEEEEELQQQAEEEKKRKREEGEETDDEEEKKRKRE
ncbi:uncharacterized protein LOC135197537 [Macrobrachium nipponense]|uniref:uncharacterized protein LOC135197537 n=1 Tax=Macrobrachium nipponense TaxID=159736 RepID=UPI0030C7FC85